MHIHIVYNIDSVTVCHFHGTLCDRLEKRHELKQIMGIIVIIDIHIKWLHVTFVIHDG